MNRSRRTIAVLAAIGVLLIIYFLLNRSDEKRYKWNESYSVRSTEPYGTSFLKKLLESYRPEGKFRLNDRTPLVKLLDTTRTGTDYIFIGPSLHLDYNDADALLAFVHNGNDAFIASLQPPENLIHRIHNNECNTGLSTERNLVDSVTMNFFHEGLRSPDGYHYAYRFVDEDVPYPWDIFDPALFCDATSSIIPLGHQLDNQVNFLRIPYGSGNFYLHCNPLVFTNYFLTRPAGADYAAKALSHLRGHDIIWDEYSKVPLPNNENVYDSPLYYFLQQPALKYAWWLMLLTILLYVIFAAKRTQRVIPVLEAKTNTSLEFVRLIASLHHQNGNNLDMARKKMKYFLYFIRSKYGMHAQHFSEPMMSQLAEKSKVSLADIQSIFNQYNLIERKAQYNIDATRLVDFYNAIEHFYKHCK